MVSLKTLIHRSSFLLAPILFSPLIYYGPEFQCMYMIAVMFVYWITEVIPPGITALLPLFVLPIFQIMPAKEVCMSYFKDATVMAMSSLIMGTAVEEVNLHKRIALGLLKLVGFRKQLLLFSVLAVTSMVSWVIEDVVTTAMMLPAVIAILESWQEVKDSIEKDASSSEEDVEGNKEKKKKKGLDLTTLNREERGFCKALVLSTTTGALIGGIGTLTGTMPNLIFRDQMGSGDEEVVTYPQWLAFSMPFQPLFIVASHLVLALCLMPQSFFCCCSKGKSKEEKKELAQKSKEKIAEQYKALGKFSFAEGTVAVWTMILLSLWITKKPGFVKGWSELLPNGGRGITDATVAVTIATLMFFWPRDPFKDETLKPILDWKAMKEKFSWAGVLLVAVGNAMSDGVKLSGLSQMLGCFLKNTLQSFSSFWLMVMSQVASVILTEFTTNTSTAGVIVPIMVTLASAFGLNPLYIVLPATYACSFGFGTQMATPGNALVLDTGIVSVFDMAFTGVILKVVCIAITALNFETVAYWVLDLGSKSPYANNTLLNCTSF